MFIIILAMFRDSSQYLLYRIIGPHPILSTASLYLYFQFCAPPHTKILVTVLVIEEETKELIY